MRRVGAVPLLIAGLLAAAPAAAEDEPQYVARSGRAYHAREGDVKPVVDALVALGDAYAGLWNHRLAIEAYEKAFRLAPESPLLHQQRGHRLLSIRRFDAARADLEKAVALDPKLAGAWYYLGVLRFVSGEFDAAADAFERNVALAEKPETRIGGLDWLYMSYRRAGRAAEARAVLERVAPDLEIEGNPRLYLDRMLFYKGLKTEAALFEGRRSELEKATLAFGVGNWHLANGEAAKARPFFEQVVATSAWPALAFIAAEQELARASK